MEKISQIVRSNPRVAAVDVAKSGSVRPGAPGFGRQTGESRGGPARDITTADRAIIAANDLADQRRSSETKIVDQLARDFFMSKNDDLGPGTTLVSGPMTPTQPAAIQNAIADLAPDGYTPRGSFVDVRA